MKKFILIFIVLLLIGGGAWWFLLREDPAETEQAVAEVIPPSFLDLEPFIVPVVRDSGVRKMIQVDLAVELKGTAEGEGDGHAGEGEGLTRLTDAFVSELYGLFGRRQMEERQYDLAIVKRRLQSAADKAMGEGRVVAVLVQGILVAPVR
jgi:hypothetical protein